MGRGCPVWLLLLVVTCGCTKTDPVPPKTRGKPIAVTAPLGLPPVPLAADNPVTAETVALGKKLFFSTALSADATISCASCHDPNAGFADSRRFSVGVGGKLGTRNAPPILNAAYNKAQFWDGRAASLEAQASGPMMNALEMAHTPKGVERRLAEDPELRPLFNAAFGPGPVTLAQVTYALAAYERTIVRANSPFDRYLYGGDSKAMSESARRGLRLFRGVANCSSCHLVGEKNALFTDNQFHNLGVGMNAEGELTDLGRYEVTHRDGDQGAFKTPSLRNVVLTAPYMHDGSLKTLKEVVDFYVGGGNANPYRDKLIQPLTNLTKQERSDLIAFLESLTGEAEP